jgi:hypothetical protein
MPATNALRLTHTRLSHRTHGGNTDNLRLLRDQSSGCEQQIDHAYGCTNAGSAESGPPVSNRERKARCEQTQDEGDAVHAEQRRALQDDRYRDLAIRDRPEAAVRREQSCDELHRGPANREGKKRGEKGPA